MKIGRIEPLQSMPMTSELPDNLYGDEFESDNKDELKAIVSVFSSYLEAQALPYSCFVPKEVMMDALNYFNEEYLSRHVEATGAVVGYYLHDPGNEEKKMAVGTRFLRASGNASSVTCEFTYDDSMRFSRYCEENKLIILVWIHSHPGFGVRFSSVDDKTLLTNFNANHQVGVVVDNVHGTYNAYKAVNGEVCEIDLFGFSLSDCLSVGSTKVFRYASTRPSYRDIAIIGVSEDKESAEPEFDASEKEVPEKAALEKIVLDTEMTELKQDMEEVRISLKRISWVFAVAVTLVMMYSTYMSHIRHPVLNVFWHDSVPQKVITELKQEKI